jgi:hypothetical protein
MSAIGVPVGEKRLQGPGIVAIATVLVAATLLVIYTIIQFWPSAASMTGGNLDYFGASLNLPEETRIFAVVAAAGALGGILHSLRSLMWYVGNRDLRRSWILTYCLLPFVGALLATIFYVVVRGGLLTVQASSGSLNVYGFAAVGAIVGLFSEQAAAKLKDVFATLFAPAEQGKDHVSPTQQHEPSANRIVPTSGSVGTDVTILGSSLAQVTSVEFGGAGSPPSQRSDTSITVLVPVGAQTGEIVLSVGETKTTTGISFIVT